jgi:hypothetical protein
MSDLSSQEIARLNEFGESDAWINFYQCAPENFKREYRLETRQVGSLWVSMIPGLDWTFFNRITCLGIAEKASETMLDDALAVLEKTGNQNYMAQVCPAAEPPEIAEWLAARGFERKGNWAKVYRDDRPAPRISTDLGLEIIDKKMASAFADVAIAAFGMPQTLHSFVSGTIGQPGWVHIIAFDHDEPVAVGALFVKGTTGWLGFGATLSSHRKRGGQGAIMARRIAEGINLGCRWFVTETGEDSPENPNPSYHNMLRTGFQLAYQRPNYLHEVS